MRQFGSGSNLENSKSYKSIDRENTGNMPRMTVSQSAPHTPVSAASHSESHNLKTVPRLLSEPIVSSHSRTSSGGKFSKSDRSSPYLQDKKLNSLEDTNDTNGVGKSLKVPIVNLSAHSPKVLLKRDSRLFSLKSPLVKRDTKSKLENIGATGKYTNNDATLDSNLTAV